MSPSTIGRMTTSLIALGTSAPSFGGHQRHRDIQHPVAESPLVVAPAARVRSLNICFAHVSLRRNEVGSQPKPSLCGHQRHRDIQHPVAESPLVVAPAARVRSLNIRFAHVSPRRTEVGSQPKPSLCGHQRHRDIQHPIAESPLVVAPAARVRSLNIRFAHVSLRRNEVGSQSKSRHFAAISAIVTSSIRLLNPHSLSYQLLALTSRPDTFVSVASNVDDAGSWLKSTDTSGAVLYFRMPPDSGPDSEAA